MDTSIGILVILMLIAVIFLAMEWVAHRVTIQRLRDQNENLSSLLRTEQERNNNLHTAIHQAVCEQSVEGLRGL